MTTQEMIDVMMAYTNGAQIECREKFSNVWTKCFPLWDWMDCEYRVDMADQTGGQMTPLHVQILLHHYGSAVLWPNETETSTLYRKDLCAHGLLVYNPTGSMSNYTVTKKGEAWIERILNTPIPVEKWVFEEDK